MIARGFRPKEQFCDDSVKFCIYENAKLRRMSVLLMDHASRNPFPKVKGFVVYLNLKADARLFKIPTRSASREQVELELDELGE